MTQHPPPVRYWKQWLVLSILLGFVSLVDRTATAQPTPAAGVTLSFPRNVDKKTFIGKVEEAMRQDSFRTGGLFEPGTRQQVSGGYTSAQPNLFIVTVSRVPITSPGAQPLTSTGHTIYTYVEQMPQLRDGGSLLEVAQVVQSNIRYPKAALGEALPSGKVFANFVVDTDGTVQQVTIVQGLSPAFDAAVVAAVQQLPRFEPGKQNGRPVAVAYTIPVEFKAKP